MSKEILITIPCLYGVEHTRECIESVIHKKNVSLHLVDNGAEIAVKELLNHYKASYTNVILIHNEVNIYVNPAWNQGIEYFLREKEFDYLIILNSDMTMYENWDLVLRKRLEVYPDEISMPTVINDRLFTDLVVDTEVIEGTTVYGGVNGAFILLNRKQAKIVFPIPSDIVVWFGDNYIFELLRGFGYKTLVIPNLICFHYISQNVQKVEGIGEIIEEDKIAWHEIVAPMMIEKIDNYYYSR